MGLTVPDKCVKFRDPHLNRSGEIQMKAVGCDIFGRFSNFDKSRPEVAGDVISDVAVEQVGVDVRVKFCDSNRSRDIRVSRVTQFVMDDG